MLNRCRFCPDGPVGFSGLQAEDRHIGLWPAYIRYIEVYSVTKNIKMLITSRENVNPMEKTWALFQRECFFRHYIQLNTFSI